MTSSTVRISTKIITWINRKPWEIVLQHRYYSYERTFPIHEYGVWLEIRCIRQFFVTAVPRATIGNKVALGPRMIEMSNSDPIVRSSGGFEPMIEF